MGKYLILLVGGVSSAGLNPLPLAPSAPLRHPPAPAEASPCRTSRPATSSARLRAWVRKISANGKKLTIHYAFPRPPEDGHGGVPTIRHPARRRPTHTDDVVVARPWFKPQNGKWEEPRLLTGVLPTAQDGSPTRATGRTWVAVVIVGVSRSKRVVLRESGPQRWARWKGWLEDGTCGSRAEVARREGVSRAAVTQGLGKLEGL